MPFFFPDCRFVSDFILELMVVCVFPSFASLSDGDVATFFAPCCDMHVSHSRALYKLEFRAFTMFQIIFTKNSGKTGDWKQILATHDTWMIYFLLKLFQTRPTMCLNFKVLLREHSKLRNRINLKIWWKSGKNSEKIREKNPET